MATLRISSDLENVIKKVVLDTYFPVGSLYLTVGSENPNNTIGGTWVRFGNGKTLVGVDTNDSDFNSVEKTGGSKYLQSHSHTLFGNTSVYSSPGSGFYNIASAIEGYNNGSRVNIYHNNFATTETGKGNSQNLQPYITVYMWKRTK